MGKKHRNLFGRISDTDNLWTAYRRAAAGRRRSGGFLAFREHEAANISALRRALRDGSYKPSAPRLFQVHEKKTRSISALPFHDRVVQHAIVNVMEPIFERVFLPQSFACRPCQGTHKGVKQAQATMRRMSRAGMTPWFLHVDFASYFSSIDLEILGREIRRKVSCRRTLDLFEKFHPPEGTGIPIGNRSSQLAANVYGHILDRWLAQTIRPYAFIRYMDDTVVFGPDRDALRAMLYGIRWFAETRMRLSLSHWRVGRADREGLNFLGYRIWPTHKLLRRDSVVRAKRKLRRLPPGSLEREQFLAAWRGHAGHANTYNLMRRLEIAA